jgi:hypothetical protein
MKIMSKRPTVESIHNILLSEEMVSQDKLPEGVTSQGSLIEKGEGL